MGSDQISIGVVSHDAGSSEILAAYIKAHIHEAKWRIYAPHNSPFESICTREGLSTQNHLDLYECDALFFGTGWQQKPERPFVKEAKLLGIPSFGFLDHWSSYQERFDYPDPLWRKNLPNFIIVSDTKAEELAKGFALAEVLRIKNYYLQDQLARMQEEKSDSSEHLLFLSEPTKEVALSTYKDANYWGFDQYSALEEILKHFDDFNCSGLHIRLHPSQNKHEYTGILKKFPHIKSQIYPASFYPLEKDLLRAKLIIGFDTMALYSAALAHKPVLSFLPSQNREFLLPLPPSHQLRDLNKLREEHLRPLPLKLEDDGQSFAIIKEKIKEFRAC